MGRFEKEINFDEDIELMSLTYKMNTGNFINYNEEIKVEENIIKQIKEN